MVEHAAVVDNKVIENFIVIDQDNISVDLDEAAVKAWLHETCAPYDTVGTKRTYTTPSGDKIKLSGGHYGWETDEATELPLLIEPGVEKRGGIDVVGMTWRQLCHRGQFSLGLRDGAQDGLR